MAHPLVRDLVLNAIDIGEGTRNAIMRQLGMVTFPVPPRSNMKRTSSPSVQHYLESGQRTARPVLEAVARYGLQLGEGSSILDLGAGVGRQIRIMRQEFPTSEIYACDVEPSHMRWLAKAYPSVHCSVNRHDESLEYTSEKFELVYAVAMFTHLEPGRADFWIEEIERILKPGGLACLSIIGSKEEADFGTWLDSENLNVLDRQGYHHDPYDIGASRAIAEKRRFLKETAYLSRCGDGYGQTFYRRNYVFDHWQKGSLSVAELQVGVIDGLQDMLVLRKV